MKTERNIREMFGVDSLTGPSRTPKKFAGSSMSVADSAEDAANTLFEQAQKTKKILQMKKLLGLVADGNAKLYDLITPAEMDFPTLLAVAGELEKAGLIQVVERDRVGNWNVAITEQGRNFLSIMS